MLSKITIVALSALCLLSNYPGVQAAPTASCAVGKYKVNGVCKTISPCILTGGVVGGVLNALGVKIDSNNVLNLDSNTCSTRASCTGAGGSITTTTVGGIAGIPLCKTKPSTGPAKSCPSSLVLDPKLNVCLCASGLVFSDSTKKSCIKSSSCKSPSKVVSGVCTAPSKPTKSCSTDKVLDINTGLCICGSGKVVDEVSGLCIDKKSCNTQVSTIISGVCTRKRCEADLHLNKVGVCVCPAGEVLRAQGSNLCVSVNLCATVLNGVCKVLKDSGAAGGLGLGSIIHS